MSSMTFQRSPCGRAASANSSRLFNSHFIRSDKCFAITVRTPSMRLKMVKSEERRLILHIGEAGLNSFGPREDEVIAFHLDEGIVSAEEVDGETAILRLTPAGQTA